jgi:hypothetical protein
MHATVWALIAGFIAKAAVKVVTASEGGLWQ